MGGAGRRPRLVVADRLGRHRLRDLRDQHAAVQEADARALRQRLHRRAARAGAVRRGDHEARAGARQRAAGGGGRDPLHGLRARRARPARSSGSARRSGRSRSAAATARTPTRRRRRSPTASVSTPRSVRTSASSVYSLDGTLLWKKQWTPKPIYLDFGTALVADRARRPRLPAAGQRRAARRSSALDAKTGAEIWRTARPGTGFPLKSSWMTPFVWKNALRTEIVTTGHGAVISYDLRRQGAVAVDRHVDADRRRRSLSTAALCRHRCAGRRQPSVPGDQAGRERRHLAEAGRDQQRVHRLVAIRAPRATRRRRSCTRDAPISCTTPAS